MTRTQTIMWTALPNGATKVDSAGKQKLRLSIFVSPRLETTASMGTLGEFPDFESLAVIGGFGSNWASTVNGLSFQVETLTTTTPVKRARYTATVVSKAEPELWDQFFGPRMPIKQFKFKDFSQVSMRTFSTSSVFATVKSQYQAVASKPSLMYKLPTIAKLVELSGVSNPPLITVLPTPILRTSAVRALAAAPIRQQDSSFSAFELFHRPYDVPAGFTPPPIPPMDFHRALSALGSYPALLRRLGIIIDIEVPYTAAMASASRIRIMPTWPDGRAAKGAVIPTPDGLGVVHNDVRQWTAYGVVFTSSLPRRVDRFYTVSSQSYVSRGYLVLRDTDVTKDPVKFFNVDVDLGASRMLGTAINAAEIVNQNLPAAARAAAESGESVAAATVASAASSTTMGLPTLGQPVIGMAVNKLATRVKNQMKRATAMNAQIVAAQEEKNVSYIEDVTRGYRIDVWDSVTRHWHRLCQRTGTYTIGDSPITWGGAATLTDEGWVQIGGISKPEDVLTDAPPTAMRIHESVFEWSGWSLAVPRPGTALSEPDAMGESHPTKTFVGPDGQTHDIGHYLHPDLPLDVRYRVPDGTLPRIRFGTRYRFRARVVDLAGNSIAFSTGTTKTEPGGSNDTDKRVSRSVTHKRYDPVKPPVAVMVESPKPSESPYVVVVRSYHDPSSDAVTTEHAARHLTPPRTSVTMAEACGGLDAESVDGKPLDTALYSTLCTHDSYDFAMDAEGQQKPQPAIPSPVAYLPDRFSRGAALSALPGVAASQTTKILGTSARISGAKVYLTSTSTKTVAATRVGFETSGAPWFSRRPFRLNVKGIEGTDSRLTAKDTPVQPVWDESARILSVELPKGDEIKAGLSSYANASDLKVMGVYQWGLEPHVPALKRTDLQVAGMITASAAAPSVPTATSSSLPSYANSLIAVSTIGQNWLLTPKQRLTLVHAVDRPMIPPKFTTRAHMERKPGQVHATLVDWMPVHGKSTTKIEITANWTECVDDVKASAPRWKGTAVVKQAAVFNMPIGPSQTTVLNAGQSVPKSMRTVAWGKVPSPKMLVSYSSINTKPQRHHFGDTKHRLVHYTARYTTRFQKYFADMPELTFTETSGRIPLHVPSSARPAVPAISHILPTWGWTRTATTSTRSGGGLRVYLERPWFSSGDDEALAVVLYQPRTNDAGYEQLRRYVTEWGTDPIWKALGGLPSFRPPISGFKSTIAKVSDLKLAEYGSSPVRAAVYAVDYDPESKLWFADIVVSQGKAYFPFVKLALARYQRYSLTNYELSPVIRADFVQLTPDRFASVTPSGDGFTSTVSLTGRTYIDNDGDNLAEVTVTLEKLVGPDEDTGWSPLGDETAMTRKPRTTYQIVTGDTRTTWTKIVKLPENVIGTRYRAVIREYEQIRRYGSSTAGKRLVYADTIELDT